MSYSLKFSYNWNNKLNCNFFTTIRKDNPLFQSNEVFNIIVNDNTVFTAKILHVFHCTVASLTECQCLHDTGYSKAETRAILSKMHHIDMTEIDNFMIALIYLARVHPIRNTIVTPELRK